MMENPLTSEHTKCPLAHEAKLDHQLKILQDTNVIQESTGSLWGAPTFLVFKEDEQGNPS